MIPRHRALAILTECKGDEIWSVEHCLSRGVPQSWIDELVDTFESGFRTDRETIYIGDVKTNHYRGVRDVDLAIRLATTMGLDVDRVTALRLGRHGIVTAIKQSIMDGD